MRRLSQRGARREPNEGKTGDSRSTLTPRELPRPVNPTALLPLLAELSKAGGGTLLVFGAIYGFSRLLARRASYFSKVKLASRSVDDELLERSIENLVDEKREGGGKGVGPALVSKTKGPRDVFTNAATVGAISVVLFVLSSKIDGYISSIELPDQYTVRQVSVTLKTIVVGLSYLACFIYGANTLGLFLLGVDMVVNPEKHAEMVMDDSGSDEEQ